MPPTTIIDQLRFNLCADLKHVEGAEDRDRDNILNHPEPSPNVQCEKGTRAYLTIRIQENPIE